MSGMNNAHALVIGIAQYAHAGQLPPTVLEDAQVIHNLLIDPAVCGYAPENVQLLLDQQANRAAICQALDRLATRCDEQSTVLIYISSHGARIDSGPHSGEYLLPVDADLSSDQTWLATTLSGDQFTQALRAIRAGRLAVMFDCCHSGGIGQTKTAPALPVQPGLPEQYYEALKTGRGRVIFASSRSDEVSWIMPNAANSLFTQYLAEGLRGAAGGEDEVIRIFDLFEYLQPRVTGDQPRQHPLFKAEIEENFALALRLGGQKGPSRQDAQGFRYDAYISYTERDPDSAWVWDTLLPRLEAAGLRVAVSGDSAEPGVARVVSAERGIQQSKRTVLVLSDAYLDDHMADFENTLAQTMGIQEGKYRLLPIRIAPVDPARLPTRLGMLTLLDMTHPRRAEREFERLVQALRGPLPIR